MKLERLREKHVGNRMEVGIKSSVLVGGSSIGEEEVSGGLMEILRDSVRRCLHKQISC